MSEYKSKEDYLERILMLSEKKGNVRAIDIANDMNFSKPSVSIALKKLKASDLITVNDYGHISLTKKGFDIANEIYEKHKILSSIFIMMGVSEKTALEDACKIEHDISDETFLKIKQFVEKE